MIREKLPPLVASEHSSRMLKAIAPTYTTGTHLHFLVVPDMCWRDAKNVIIRIKTIRGLSYLGQAIG
jgi:hypothetical protein